MLGESLHLPFPKSIRHFISPIYDDESSMLYKFPTRNFLIKLKCWDVPDGWREDSAVWAYMREFLPDAQYGGIN